MGTCIENQLIVIVRLLVFFFFFFFVFFYQKSCHTLFCLFDLRFSVPVNSIGHNWMLIPLYGTSTGTQR